MWTKLEVYNHDSFIGSFYTRADTKQGIVEAINEEYGMMWTRYNIGN